jgi:hypothetical protein
MRINCSSRVIFYKRVSIPDDNSLSNLGTLRGIFGTHPRVSELKIALARYSLSIWKPCLESYILERTTNKKTVSYFIEK